MNKDDKEHSHLAPSKSHIWRYCAATLNYSKYQRVSWFMRNGTAAHMLLEVCLCLSDDPEKYIGDFIFEDIEVTDDMATAVGHALDFVNQYQEKNPTAKIYIEQKVDPFVLLKCPEGLASGTLDLGFDNRDRDELVLIDYKHGIVNVEVKDNWQLLQYVLGFISQYATRKYKRYVLVIIQPRELSDRGPIRFVKITHDELMAHAAIVAKRIKEIRGNPNQLAAGEWCRFCPAGARCKERAKYAMQVAQAQFKDRTINTMSLKEPNEITPKQLGQLLKAWHDIIEPWGHALYASALEMLLAGKRVDGQKLVLGKTTRRFGHINKTARLLYRQFGFSKDEIAPRKLLTVAGVEKLFKKRVKRGRKSDPLPPPIKELIIPSNPSIRVAREDDPRREYRRGSEFQERE